MGRYQWRNSNNGVRDRQGWNRRVTTRASGLKVAKYGSFLAPFSGLPDALFAGAEHVA